MRNPVSPFQQHLNAIIVSEIKKSGAMDITNYPSFLENLSSISKFAFDQDFCDFGSGTLPLFELQQNCNQLLQTSDTILNDYNQNFFNNKGLEEFSQKYPLISTLAKDVLEQTENFYTEIHNHITADKDSLAQIFNNNITMGNVIAIGINQGDVHNGGKSTAIVEFESGFKVVYKPRSGAMDAAFNLLLGHLTVQTGLQLKTVITLDRGDYFWMEFIEHKAVSSKKELNDYYIRCGALLAVCYLLNGTDFHYENVIAHGEFPVLIDLECLFGATDEMEEGTYSVYNTGLVPLSTYEGEKSEPTDSSGFGATGQQISGIEGWKWQDINTDALRLCRINGTFTAETNQPEYNNQKISPERYLGQLLEGFSLVCGWFIAQKDQLDKPDFILADFKDKEFRVVIRNTVDYKTIIDNSLVAKALCSEQDRRQKTFDSLQTFQPFIYLDNNIKMQVVDKEFAAIKTLNIPLFTGSTSGTNLYESGNLAHSNFFKIKPYEFTINKLKKFTESDIQRQENLIKSAFFLRYNLKATSNRTAFKKPEKLIECTDAILIEEARTIAANIKKSAIKNGQAFIWNSYTSMNNKQVVYNTLGNGFYEGNTGMGYFFSVLSRITGNREYEKISECIINAEIKRCNSEGYETDISMATGLAGLIYTLLKSPDDSGIQNALSLLSLIKPEAIYSDNKLDVMSGTAGLLLVLTLLYKHTISKDVLELMKLAGDHLVNSLSIDEASGLRTWKSEAFKRPVTGFSHGASGIGCALLSLYECTGNDKYKDIFYEALQFEDYYKDDAASNWQDVREHNQDCKTAWCHGAAGIGLARLHAYKIVKDNKLLTDVEMAITAVKNAAVHETDCYCCGITGRADFLIEAAAVLKRPVLLDDARGLLSGIISAEKERNYFWTHERQEISLENPSLFRGTAGIGYTFLRAMDKSGINCLGLLQ